MSSHNWIPKRRSYVEEEKEMQASVQLDSAEAHPLVPEPQVAQVIPEPMKEEAPPSDVLDPLSGRPSVLDEDVEVGEDNEYFIPWQDRTRGILKKYTTDELVGIKVDFMETGARETASQEDRTQARLELLDDSAAAKEKRVLKLNQKDYIRHIQKLHRALSNAWKKEQRVKSLKIAIQCAKTLADTTVIQFYPSKWTLITQVLDTFGALVYQRIIDRAMKDDHRTGAKGVALPEHFTAEDVPEAARETCRNWFFKIASVRELLPRLYVEIAIIGNYKFLSADIYKQVIYRQNLMLRGVGDPLIATYLRAYLARKGWEVLPMYKDYVIRGFYDYLFIHDVMMAREPFQSMIESYQLTREQYLDLYTPAVDWLLSCIAYQAKRDVLEEMLAKYREYKNPLVLHFIITSFTPAFIAEMAPAVAILIQESESLDYPKFQIYAAFGQCLCRHAPASDKVRGVLGSIWQMVSKIENPVHYMKCAEVWIEYPSMYLEGSDIDAILSDIIQHIKPEKAYEGLQDELLTVVTRLLAHMDDYTVVFNQLHHFLPLLDLFDGEHKVTVNRLLLEGFVANHKGATMDPLIISTMFQVCKTVHDSINALSFDDDVKRIGMALCAFMCKIDFGKQVDKHLQFFVECRSAFANLDAVKETLVISVCGLAMKTLKLAGGKHSTKTSAFVRACIAFCFVTIPTMEQPFPQLRLYMLSASAAMMNGALPQADDLLKACVATVKEVPVVLNLEGDSGSSTESVERQLVEQLEQLASLLVAAPGHPEEGPFYLVRGLLKVVIDYPWEEHSAARGMVYLALLKCLYAHAQDTLPYHVAGVDGNDVLYAGEASFMAEIKELMDGLVDLLLKLLAGLQGSDDPVVKRRQAELASAVCSHAISFLSLKAKTATLVYNLYTMAKTAGATKEDLLPVERALVLRKDENNFMKGLSDKILA